MRNRVQYHNKQDDYQNNRRKNNYKQYEQNKYDTFRQNEEEKKDEKDDSKQNNDGYIPREKWDKLTSEQRKEIYNKRKGIINSKTVEEKTANIRSMAAQIAEILKLDLERVQRPKRAREESKGESSSSSEGSKQPELKKTKV